MKRLFFYSTLIVFLYSCQTKDSSSSAYNTNSLENFSFSVDTLVLDVGAENFNSNGYSSYDLSEDGNSLFLFYEPEKEMHEYDMAEKKLVSRHHFERDGPNLIPSYFNYFQALPNDEFFMTDLVRSGTYRLDGKKLTSYKLRVENISGLNLDASFQLTKNSYISPDKQTLVSLPSKYGAPPAGLAVLDLKSMSGKILDLPALEMTENYQVIFEEEMSQSGDFITTQFLHDQFIIYSGATSAIYTYDWKRDSLKLHTFPHTLVAKSKTGEFPTKINSEERRKEVSKLMQKQITFGKFYWDETRKNYFRIGTTNEDYTKAYLFSYDENFDLTGETLIPDFYYIPYMEFFHAGKLYSFINVGEEPALVEFTFDF